MLTPNECYGMAACIDGTSNTVMMVEIQNSGILWAEPRDLDRIRFAAAHYADVARRYRRNG